MLVSAPKYRKLHSVTEEFQNFERTPDHLGKTRLLEHYLCVCLCAKNFKILRVLQTSLGRQGCLSTTSVNACVPNPDASHATSLDTP